MAPEGSLERRPGSPQPGRGRLLAVDDPVSFEGKDVPEPIFLAILSEAVKAIEADGIPYGLLGGVASAVHGRPRWTHDIDFFVRAEDAPRVLDALERADFATQRTNPHWLFKGIKRGVLVDVLFRAKGDLYLDDEMIARLRRVEFKGCPVMVIPPEDLLVIKAIIHDEETPRHWGDALGVIAGSDLDWDYLLARAQHGARRVLSLLLYAQSTDLVVPEEVIRSLFETIYSSKEMGS